MEQNCPLVGIAGIYFERCLMRIAWFMVCFALTVSLMQAQDGLVWKKKMFDQPIVSVVATQSAQMGVVMTTDSLAIWDMTDGKIIEKMSQKYFGEHGITSATIDRSKTKLIVSIGSTPIVSGYAPTVKVMNIADKTIDTILIPQFPYGHNWDMYSTQLSVHYKENGYDFLAIVPTIYSPYSPNFAELSVMYSVEQDSSKKYSLSNFQDDIGRLTKEPKIINNNKIIYLQSLSKYTQKKGYEPGYETITKDNYCLYDLKTKKFVRRYDFPYYLMTDDLQLSYGNNILYETKNSTVFRDTVMLPGERLQKQVFFKNNATLIGLCTDSTKGYAVGIWDILRRRWYKRYEGSIQSSLFFTENKSYAVTGDTKGNISLWKLPDSIGVDSLYVRFELSDTLVYRNDKINCTNRTFPFSLNYKYEWDLGDGRKSSDIYPIISYPVAGEYHLKLTVTTENGIMGTQSRTIKVLHKPEYLEKILTQTTHNKILFMEFAPNNQELMFYSNKDTLYFTELSSNITDKTYSSEKIVLGKYHNNDIVEVITNNIDVSWDFSNPHQYLRLHRSSFNKKSKFFDKKYSFKVYNELYNQEERVWLNYGNMISLIPKNVCGYLSSNQGWFAVGVNSVVRVTLDELRKEPIEFNRGSIIIADVDTAMSDDRDAKKMVPCQSFKRLPIHSLDVPPSETQIAMATGVFNDPFNTDCARVNPLIRIISSSDKKIIASLNDNTSCVRYSVDGYHLWSTNGIWDIDSNRKVVSLQTGLKGQFEVLPDGEHVVAVSPPEKNALAGIYSMREQRWKAYYYGSSALGLTDVSAMAVSSDGAYCALGSSTGTVTLWAIPELTVKPSADFRSGVRRVRVGDSVIFDNMSVPYNGDLSYEWDYGDGSKSHGRRGVHVYHDIGFFSVGLRISNSAGEHSEKQKSGYIEVESPSSVESSNEISVRVYPNPCDDVLTVECDGFYDVMVYNVQGNEVYKSIKNKLLSLVDTSSFSHGMYIVKVRTEAGLHFFPSFISHQ